jgi:hypothetical protein
VPDTPSDRSNIFIYLAAFLVAGAGVGVFIFLKKKSA